MERRASWRRNDMHGAALGLDRRLSAAAYNAEKDPFRRGLLRSILTGSVLTPGRWRAAKRLTEAEARCGRCNVELDTVGHWWRCPALHKHRERHGLHDKDMDLDWLPPCLSRCGLMPRTFSGYDQQTKKKLALAIQRCLADMLSDVGDSAHFHKAMQLAKSRVRSRVFVHDPNDLMDHDEMDEDPDSDDGSVGDWAND